MRKSIFVIGTLCALLLAGVRTVKAELIPYEPGGNTLPPSNVAKGQLILQTRLINYSDEYNGEGSFGINLGASEFRYGLTDRLEARLNNNSGVQIYDGAAGLADLGLGFKANLVAEQHGWLPITSVFGTFTIPMGPASIKSPGLVQNYTLSTLHNLTDHTTALTNIAVNFADQGSGTEDTIDLYYSGGLGYAINDKWGLGTDIYGSYELKGANGNPVAVDLAVTYNVNDNVALDASIALGLNESAPDLNIGGGISVALYNPPEPETEE